MMIKGDSMKFRDQKTFNLKEVLLIVLFTVVAVVVSTGLIISKRIKPETEIVNIKDENIANFIDAYQTLVNNYYEDIDKKELMDTVINSMTTYFKDPYTTYLDKEQTETLVESLKGEYQGVGVRITAVEEGILVLEVFEDSPASNAGILINDIIVELNGKTVIGRDLVDVTEEITTSEKEVKIKVKREDELKDFTIKIEKVNIPSVYSDLINSKDKKIGYLIITTFASNTYTQFKEKLKYLEKQEIDSLIIDVRGDTGGYLTAVTDILELFLKKGQKIYSVESKLNTNDFFDETDEHRNYKVIVLGNETSASASEILIGAMKDSYKATFVGKTTYGKGKIQQTSSLEDGGLLKYTIAKWYVPSGVCIDEVGIKPDYEVTNEDSDLQLLKAVELLSE